MGEPCLVYSFGLSNDISFEESMARRGCQVQAFDPTISRNTTNTAYPERLNIHFVGLAQNDSPDGNYKTLSTILEENGHQNSVINYLKASKFGIPYLTSSNLYSSPCCKPQVDIEGHERPAMSQWFSSGSLDNVRQIGIEFHAAGEHARSYFESVQKLYGLGFKIIAWDPNLWTTIKNGNLGFFEIVFR